MRWGWWARTGFDLSTLRLPSVLGRLGGAYLLAALALIWLPSRPARTWEGIAGRLPEVTDFAAAWCAVGALTAGYLGLTLLYPVPGCPTGCAPPHAAATRCHMPRPPAATCRGHPLPHAAATCCRMPQPPAATCCGHPLPHAAATPKSAQRQ